MNSFYFVCINPCAIRGLEFPWLLGVVYRGTRPNMMFENKVSDVFHTIIEGDRIDLLAYKYYADPALWWVIADANELKNPLRIEIGKRLRIPAKSTVYRRLNE